MQVEASREPDAILQAFLRETTEIESNRLLEKLVCEYAQPLAKQIIRAKLRIHSRRAEDGAEAQDSEDISHEITLQLLQRLRAFKANPDEQEFSDFRAYVATIAYNAYHRYLRQKYPERYRLKNKLRYILTHQRNFALWCDDGSEWLCGLSDWQHQKRPRCRNESLQQLRGNAQLRELARQAYEQAQATHLAHLLTAMFFRLGNPVELEELINVVAGLSEIKEPVASVEADDDTISARPDPFVDLSAKLATRQEQLSYLQQLWAEIGELPIDQRTALLFSLRDKREDDMVTLLIHLRIASLRQVAETLALPAEELAQLWKDLPLDDMAIAARLGVTRQQVISLRLSARRRLERRTRSFSAAK